MRTAYFAVLCRSHETSPRLDRETNPVGRDDGFAEWQDRLSGRAYREELVRSKLMGKGDCPVKEPGIRHVVRKATSPVAPT